MTAARQGAGRVARNAASSYGAQFVRALTVLVLTPYLYRRLGPGGFGTWSVILTVTSLFALLELGASTGVRKYVAQFHAERRRAELRSTLGAAAEQMWVLGAVAAALALGIGLLAPGLAGDGLQDEFRAGMAIVGVAMLARFPLITYGAALLGHQRWTEYSLADAVGPATLLVGGVIVVEAGGGIVGLSAVHAAGLVASGVLMRRLMRRIDPELSARPRDADAAARRRMLHFGSFTLLAESMVTLAQRMDVIVIAALRSAAEAAPFAAVHRLVSLLNSLCLPFVFLLMPMVSDLWARGEREEIGRRFTLVTRLVVQITVPVAAAAALFAPEVVTLLLGEQPGDTVWIVVVLMCLQVLTLGSYPAEQLLLGVGRVRPVGLLALAEGLSNIALSVVLVIELGALGAAIASLCTSAVLSPIKVPLACRAIGHPVRRLLRNGVGVALASSLPGIALMVAARVALPEGPLRLSAGVLAGLAVCVAVAAGQVGPRRIASLVRQLVAGRRSAGEAA